MFQGGDSDEVNRRLCLTLCLMDRKTLKEIADREGILADAFSLDGQDQEQRYVLTIEEGGWSTYFVERGERVGVEHFETEDDACEYLLQQLLGDETTRRHFETREDIERRLYWSE